MKSTSLFQMSSEQEYQITILNSFMKYNLMHQYEQNDRIFSGLIFNIDCPYCTIKITNLSVEDNLVTNTTDNVISLKAKSISIRQSKFLQNSIFQYSILQPYLLWGFHQNEEIFVEQIEQKFPIRVITGNIKLIGQNIQIENLNITNSSGLAYCTIQNNTVLFGGGFAIADQISQNLTRLGSVLNENNVLKFGANLAQLPSSLSITTDMKNVLPKIKIIEQSNLLIEQIEIKPYQVFTNTYSDAYQISQCINLLNNCLGGWKEGDTSCFIGHIGALCEECDIYNLRGEGNFSTSTKYSCSSCAENDTNSIIITAIIIWTLVSILISVKGTVSLLEDIALKVQVKKIRFFMSMQESYSGILIKMLTNHLQILSTITTFKLNLPNGMLSTINASETLFKL